MSVTFVELRLETPGGEVLLPRFSSLTFDTKYNDFGAISFGYPLEDAKTLGLTDQSFVNVRLGFSDNTSVNVERYLIEGTDDTKVSDEGRLRTLAGRSSLAQLDDAVVYPSNWPVTSPTGHEFVDMTYGTILNTLITRAHNRGTLTAVTTDFTATLDSASADWASLNSQNYPTGTSYVQVITEAMQRGIIDVRMVDDVLQVYNGGTLGSNVAIETLEVRPAKNVTELTTTTTSAESCSTVLIEGEEGTSVERNSAPALALLGRRRERFVSQGGIADSGVLTLLGDAELDLYGRIPAEETVGVVDTSTARPFVDYDVADWLWVRYETEAAPTQRRVQQIALSVDSDRKVGIGLTLNTILYESDIRLQRKMESYIGSADGAYGSVPNSQYDLTVPNPPTTLNVTSGYYTSNAGTYSGAFTATWVAPSTNVDGTTVRDLAGYDFQWKYTTDTDWSATLPSVDTVVSYSPVTPGRQINARVRARDTTGHVSTWLTLSPAHTLATDTDAPVTPSTPVATDGIESIEVTWDGKDNTGAAMVSDLKRVELWASATTPFTPGTGDNAIVGQYPYGGGKIVVKGTQYDTATYFKLVAVDNAENRSGASLQASAIRKRSYETPVVAPTSAPTLQAIGGVGAIHLRWPGVTAGSLVTYEVYGSTQPNFTTDVTTLIALTDQTAFTVRNLPKNLFYDGSFESGLAGSFVNSAGNATLAVLKPPAPVVPVHGDYVMRVTANSTANQSFRPVPAYRAAVTVGNQIRLQVRALGINTTKTFRMSANWYTAGGSLISSTNTSAAAMNTSTWTTLSEAVTVPATTATGEFVVTAVSAASGDQMYFDLAEAYDAAVGDPLSYGLTYYFKVRARTSPTATGPYSSEVSATLHQIGDTDISTGYTYLGNVSASQVTTGTLSADVTLSGTVKTSESGQRVVMDSLGLHLFASDGISQTIDLPTSPGAVAQVRSSAVLTDVTILDGLQLRGQNNIFTMGSKVVLQTTTAGSSTPPTLSADYPQRNVRDVGGWASVFGGWGWCTTGFWFNSAKTRLEACGALFGDGWVMRDGAFYNYKQIAEQPSGSMHTPWKPYTSTNVNNSTGDRMVILGEDHTTNPMPQWPEVHLRVYDTSNVRIPTTSISRTSGVATATVASHQLVVGDWINIYGSTGGFDVHLTQVTAQTPTTVSWASPGSDVGATAQGSDARVEGPPVQKGASLGKENFSWFRNDRLGRCFSPVGQTTLKNSVAYLRDNLWEGVSEVVLQVITCEDTGPVVSISRTIAFEPATDEHFIGVSYGSSEKMGFPGTNQTIWVLHGTQTNYVFLDGATPTRLTNLEFAALPNVVDNWPNCHADGDLSTNSFSAFHAVQGGTSTRYYYEYTDTVWDTSTTSSTWWGGYTWNDTNTSGYQTISVGAASAGTFTVTFQGQVTASIAYNATAAAFQTAMDNLSNINTDGGGNPYDVIVSKDWAGQNKWALNFSGQYQGQSVGQVTVTPTGLTGGTVTQTIGTTHQTNVSNLQSITMPQRARLTMTVPPYPDPSRGSLFPRLPDDVNAFWAYLGRGASVPLRTALWKQADPADFATYLQIASPTFASTNPPATTDFPNQSPASIESSAVGTGGVSKIQMTGEGYAHLEALDVGGAGATSLTGKAFDQLYFSIRGQSHLTGGGTKSVSGSWEVSWSTRFIVISVGNADNTAPSGYFDIDVPAAGTTVYGYGGATDKTVTASGIPLNNWDALWYKLPWGSTHPSVAANFRVTNYTSDYTVPNDWILLAVRNGDMGRVVWASGDVAGLPSGGSGGQFLKKNSGTNYDVSWAWLPVPEFRAGVASNTHSGAGTVSSTVWFSSTMSGTPRVTAVPSSSSQPQNYQIGVNNITSSSFSFVSNRVNTGSVECNYIAIWGV